MEYVKKIYRFIKYYIWQYLIYTLCILKPKIYFRKKNLISCDRDMEKFKNCHMNERCFVIATGPSLQIEDLEKLKNEITFSMNSIVLAFDKTEWRPTYYGIQDKYVYRKLKDKINPKELNTIFKSQMIKENLGKNQNVFTLYCFDHLFHPHGKKYKTAFSDDVSQVVYDAGTIAYSLIQIAVYMGIKEIYLLGTDCDYSTGEKEHFIDYQAHHKNAEIAADSMLKGYMVAKEYADKHGIEIYNTTRGGKLEIFERVNFDNLVAEQSRE